MLTEERTAPTLDEARAALADEWRRADPHTPAEIDLFYQHAHGQVDDLNAWHQTPERQAWTKMLVHVAQQCEAKVALDIGCGVGHDMLALHAARPEMLVFGVERNQAQRDQIDVGYVYESIGDAYDTLRRADLISCIDVLEHLPEPEHFLAASIGFAKIGALFFEATATHDHGTPLHLEANWGWHPGNWLESHGWRIVDEAGRVHVWEKVSDSAIGTSSVLVCAYRGLSATTHHAVLALAGRGWRSRTKSGDALIGRSRSIIVSSWYRETADDCFLMVDDDIGFNPADADRAVELVRGGLDIVCGAYPVHDGAHFALKVFDGTPAIAFGPGEGVTEILYAATGFMACSRNVIDAMIAELPLCHANQEWAFWPFFQAKVVEDGGQGGYAYLSEDWGFSRFARDLGFRIWMDQQTKLRHGSHVDISVNNMLAMHAAIAQT